MPPSRPSPINSPSLTRAEVNGLIDLQSKLLGEALERIQREMSLQNENLSSRLGEAIRSLEFAHKEIEDLKAREEAARRGAEELKDRLSALSRENADLKSDLARMTERLDYQDDQGRRNNLRFSGIPEERGETWEMCQRKLSDLLRQHLHITPKIERAHRVGRPTHDRPRDIVAKFASFVDREAVFKDKAKFKNAPGRVFVNEDFCAGTIKARKDQLEQLRQARSEGKNAFFSYRKLVVTERQRPRAPPDSALPMPPPGTAFDPLRLPTPLQSRPRPASLSDQPSPLMQRPSGPCFNTPPPARHSYSTVLRSPVGATALGPPTPFSPVSQRLRNKK